MEVLVRDYPIPGGGIKRRFLIEGSEAECGWAPLRGGQLERAKRLLREAAAAEPAPPGYQAVESLLRADEHRPRIVLDVTLKETPPAVPSYFGREGFR